MLFFIILVIVVILLLGGVYVLFLRGKGGEGSGWRFAARTGLGMGIAAVVLTALAGVLSLTLLLDAAPLRDPLAVAAFLGFPAALVGLVCGLFGLKSDARSAAVTGLVLSGLAIAGWIVMQAALT